MKFASSGRDAEAIIFRNYVFIGKSAARRAGTTFQRKKRRRKRVERDEKLHAWKKSTEFPSTFSLHIQWDSTRTCVYTWLRQTQKKGYANSDVRSEKKSPRELVPARHCECKSEIKRRRVCNLIICSNKKKEQVAACTVGSFTRAFQHFSYSSIYLFDTELARGWHK